MTLLIPVAALHLQRMPAVTEGMPAANYLVVDTGRAGGAVAETGVTDLRVLLATAEQARAVAGFMARGTEVTATLSTRVDATYTTVSEPDVSCARDGVVVVTLVLDGLVLEGRRAEGPRTLATGSCPRPHP